LNGVFITGTNTGIGKTTFARELMRRHPDATYWKPVQTGCPPDDDTATVGARLSLPGVRLPDPVSPHLAAERVGRTLTIDELLRPVVGFEGTLVVEGAGGLLVPIAPGVLQTELVAALGLPLVIVARDELGCINHTLLTIDAARNRGLAIAGVALLGGNANRAAIEEFGAVRVLEDPLV